MIYMIIAEFDDGSKDFKQKTFETNSLWKLYYENSKYALWMGPPQSPSPYRLAFFNSN